MSQTIEMNSEDLKRFYQKKNKSIVFEASDVELYPGWFDRIVWIENVDTGNSAKFEFTHADMDPTQEDIYGWWYANKEKDLKLLVIND